jgi:carbon-monoxide dehydrogenase large subunit
MGEFGIGQPVPREEDPYLVRGAGRYVDDVQTIGQTRAYVLRSPHAHADIVRIDATEARAKPGVLLILTGNDAEVLRLGLLRPHMPRKRRDGTPAFTSPQPFLAHERVRYLGDPVAFVIAETLEQAKDAAEAIAIAYDVLSAVPTTADSIAPNARAVWEGCPDNQAFTHAAGDQSMVAKSMGAAAHVIRHRMVINRLTANSMEPRGCIAEYAAREARYTLRCTVQGPHMIRRIIATEVFEVAETKFRVVADNVGGGFGMKGGLYPEYVLAALAARLVGRPVKWIAERSEALQSDEHGRDNITEAELGLDRDGRFLAFSVRTFCNIGAYYTSDRNAGPPTNNIGVLAGTYVIPAIHVETTAVMTNTMMTGPYRGAGRPEAAYVMETMVDLAARQLGIDPAELRRRNFILPDQFPYRSATGFSYDSGDYRAALDLALEKAGYEELRKEQEEGRRKGRLVGVGMSSFTEVAGAGPSKDYDLIGIKMFDSAELAIGPTGKAILKLGVQSQGQGHETTFAQIVAHELGISPADVIVHHGDTDNSPYGLGTFGSRSTPTGGAATAVVCRRLLDKAKKIAAYLMEVDDDDVAWEPGRFYLRSAEDREVTIQEAAAAAYTNPPDGMEPGLDAVSYYDPPQLTFPFGTYVVAVEVNPETGEWKVLKFVAVDDCGVRINPMIVDGQIMGGLTEGYAIAAMQRIDFDAQGASSGSNFEDYLVPTAWETPRFELHEMVTPCPHHPLGAKGVGESPTVGSPAAFVNAVVDALVHLGVRNIDMPLTSDKVWEAIEDSRPRKAAG